MRKILILGVTGQDGSYAADYFTQKNYKVYGVVRKSATNNFTNINHLIKRNLKNFQILKYTKKKIKYFQPISSNIFGLTKNKKQNEKTLINPNSIYALGKATALMACKMYSKNYDIFACGAIFFNHESPRRSEEYVTKKIVKQSVEIYKNKRKFISLGDIEAKIDWGYAKDYVESASKIMSLKKPDFFIIASGKSYSVRFFLKECFSYLGLDYKKYIKINKKLLRPSKTSNLIGDTTKAYKIFGFKPKTKIKQLIEIMMKNELNNS